MKRILVTGSRDWTDIDTIRAALMNEVIVGEQMLVIHGACRGADMLADKVAQSLGWYREPHPAQWQFGRGAGFARNMEMVAAGADVCLAFILNGSKGSGHCARVAEAAGIPVKRFLA